jgi:hypothetical protein
MHFFIFFIILLSPCLSSCHAVTKETYFSRYENFISAIERDHLTMEESGWTEADMKFKELSEDLYSQFKDECTWRERLLLSSYKIRYLVYRNGSGLKEALRGIFADYSVLKRQIQFYITHDMYDDIMFLYEQAKGIGEDAVNMLNEVLADEGYDRPRHGGDG